MTPARPGSDPAALRRAPNAPDLAHLLQQRVIDHLDVMISYVDKDERYRVVNRKYAQLFGIDQDMIIGRQVRDLLGEPAYRLIRDKIAAVLSGQTVRFEQLMPLPTGPDRWLDACLVPDIGETGEVLGYHAMVSDISDRKHAELRLIENQSRMQTLLGSMSAFVGLFTLHGVVLETNRTSLEVMGLERHQIIGGPVWEIAPMADLPESRAVFRDAINRAAQGERVRFDLPMRVPTGEMVLDTTVAPIYDAASRVVQIVGSGIDVTSRLRAEAALRASEARLRKAERAEAIGQLASGVAHDFNNLLLAISSFTDQASRQLASDHPARESIGLITEAVAQARGITGSLLTFARQAHSERQPVRFDQVVQRTVDLMARTMPSNIMVSCAVETDASIWVCANDAELGQIVMNLVLNARDAMPDGGRLVVALDSVGLTRDMVPTVRLLVHDTGGGLTSEQLDRAFEPYFSTKPRGKGTGLGLSIVQGIVRSLGGSIKVESSPGQGTSMSLDLPTCDPPDSDPASTPDRNRRTRWIAIIVQGDPLIRDLIHTCLHSQGFEPCLADDNDEAIELVTEHADKLGLVVLENQDASDRTEKALRRFQGFPATLPVLIVSREGTPEDTASFPHIEMPFTLDELARAIRSAAHQESP